MALQWGTMFKIVPEVAGVTDYALRVTARPNFVKVAAMDEKWASEHEAALTASQPA